MIKRLALVLDSGASGLLHPMAVFLCLFEIVSNSVCLFAVSGSIFRVGRNRV
jgi:hypothetical protein